MNSRVAVALAIATLGTTAITAAQANLDPVALLDAACRAHGGSALAGISTYRETSVMELQPGGKVSTRVAITVLVDVKNGFLRMETRTNDGPKTVTAAGPWGTAQAIGDGPLRPVLAANPTALKVVLNAGLLGLRYCSAGREKVEALTTDPLGQPGLPGVRVTTNGLTTSYWFAPDGTLDHEQLPNVPSGDVYARYGDYEVIGGVKLPRSAELIMRGAPAGSFRITELVLNQPMPELASTRPAVDPRLFDPGKGIPPEATTWIKTNAIPLERVDARGSRADLQPLKPLLKGARVVALGEATHGTSEFFRMKHRLLEFLVKDAGFNVFAIEANAAEAERVNDFVLNGRGDPKGALAGLYFWTWNTQEVLDLILWMRSYNQSVLPEHRVQFRGFDMQFGRTAIGDVVSYLQRVDFDLGWSAARAYQCLSAYANERAAYLRTVARGRDACRAGIAGVRDQMHAMKDELVARTSAREYLEMEHAARLVEETEELFARNDYSAARDVFMAENVAWLAENARPDARLVLWAHNGHVSTAEDTLGSPMMGDHLRARFGNEYLTVGFAYSTGSFNSFRDTLDGKRYPLGPSSLPAPGPQSVEAYLASSGLDRFVLNLRGLDFTTTATAWLGGLRSMRYVGAVYTSGNPSTYEMPVSPPAEYDWIVYLRDTTPSKLLPMR